MSQKYPLAPIALFAGALALGIFLFITRLSSQKQAHPLLVPMNPAGAFCSTDNHCPSGHFCNNSWDCPKGYPPERCTESGTKTCIQTCSTDTDCSSDLTCQNITILKGDAGDRKKGCLDKRTDPQVICEQNKGKWSETYQECEQVTEAVCKQAAGIFDSCASACRHDPRYPNVACIKICVPVCKFF